MNLIAEADRFCLIFRTPARLTARINPPLALMINHPLTVSVLPNPCHTTASQLHYLRNCAAQLHGIKTHFFDLPYHWSISVLGTSFVLFVRGDGSKIHKNFLTHYLYAVCIRSEAGTYEHHYHSHEYLAQVIINRYIKIHYR